MTSPQSPATALQLLELALRAARSCAKEIAGHGIPTVAGRKTSTTDPVTDADRAGEAVIRRIIKAERAEDGLLGEEGSSEPSLSGLRWVFDPLDGTVNYLYRIPHWAVSVACERFENETWQTISGVVYDATREETFSAVRGGGAFLNDVPIVVNQEVHLSDALVATEFSYRPESRLLQAGLLARVLPRVRDIRSSGSSALDLCWVAAGRWDGFYENELSRWDWSAASLIVEEAGGAVSPLGTGVVAGSRSVLRMLRELVAPDAA